jgi:glycosyltransferase involved in cell wall biosynthesis
MNNFKIRVIVPCYNSDLTIEKCISSVFRSKGIDFEVYVVDDGNNNRLAALKNEYPIKIISTSGQEGAGRARNIGTQGFDGQAVVFIDSDVQIYEETIASLVRPLAEDLSDATVGIYSRQRSLNFYDDYKNFYLFNKYYTENRFLNNTFWSAICAMDFKTYTKLKGFKECYSGAGPEDIETGIELSHQGARILSVHQAMGKHLSSFNFLKLLKNDLRKGSEDIYIHLTRKVSIACNRHVSKADIIGVFLAWCIPLLFLLQSYFGFIPLLICFLLYVFARMNFIKSSFGGEDFLFLLKSCLLTYFSDLIKGLAVIRGTLQFIMENLSAGRYKPFSKITRRINTLRV